MHQNVRAPFRRHAMAYFPPGRRVLEVGRDVHPSTLCILACYDPAAWDTIDAGLEVVVSEWGSVDLEWLGRITPGFARRRMLWQRLSGVFGLWNAFTGLPPEGAYDTITVGVKRPT